ncbi:biotin--[acetyl-CoA-carboxylase] ligase [Acuticoccus sp.]|uniref:biotin--[acetyl-CoA-carboxylase] ligase n=1 Tax=Acuticoccus sp. TaxID=1904378 RepID=UPI003B5176C1
MKERATSEFAARTPIGAASAPIIRLAEVGSTNDEAMVRLRASEVPLWVVAERQFAGRGRRARPWTSEPGNLYASYAFPHVFAPASFALLPLAAAVALADALEVVGARPSLKWPNDVRLAGAKVAGILIEAEQEGPQRRAVVGFGVNIMSHPPGLPATHLAAHLPAATPDDVFGPLRDAFGAVLNTLGVGGTGAIRARWLARADGVGEPIAVRLERETREGMFEGLDEAGRLILRRKDGVAETIAAGDVFVRGAP